MLAENLLACIKYALAIAMGGARMLEYYYSLSNSEKFKSNCLPLSVNYRTN